VSPDPPSRLWPDTHWETVLALRDPAENARAMEEICRSYWRVFVRVFDHWFPQEGKDLAQDFVLQLIQHQPLNRLDPNLGRFRQYVGRMLQNMIRKHYRAQRAQKRGLGVTPEELTDDCATVDSDGTEYFDRLWARALVDRVIEAFQEEATDVRVFRLALRELQQGEDLPVASYETLAAEWGVNAKTLGVQVSRCRRRFAERLRQEVALTTERSAIEEELAYVLRALRAGPKQ
jgi:RNA polymerase sigma factor (sigma-70 family)